jgi:hypothetical protein
MTGPPLARFLAGPESQESRGSRTATDQDEVAMLKRRLGDVLGSIVQSAGPAQVVAATGLDLKQAEVIGALPAGETAVLDELSLREAAEIIAVTSSFSAAAVRGRIRDHLLVQMSRGPVDVETVAEQYGFADSTSLRAKIEGEKPFSVREYVRLRVALRSSE